MPRDKYGNFLIEFVSPRLKPYFVVGKRGNSGRASSFEKIFQNESVYIKKIIARIIPTLPKPPIKPR